MAAGQPPKYKTVEELQDKIDEYFKSIEGILNDQWLEWLKEKQIELPEPYKWEREPQRAKITSLCLFLGFCSRQSFYDLEKREEFSYAIKKAHLRIEESYEDLVMDAKNPAGPIFALKNLGWKDKVEQDVNLHTEKRILEDLT